MKNNPASILIKRERERSEGGLQLPSISTLYQKLQASKHRQLLTSKDATVRHLAEKNLETEIKSIRKIFKPSIEVQQAMVEDPSQSRKALLKAVKNRVAYSDASRHKSELLALPIQGLLLPPSPHLQQIQPKYGLMPLGLSRMSVINLC